MKFSSTVLFLFIIVIFLSCNQSSKNLSVFHGDAAHTGSYAGSGYKKFAGIKWAFETHGKIFSSPAIASGVAYIGSEDSGIYAIDIKTGSLQWKYATNGAVSTTPAVYNNTVYAGSYDGYYYALNAKTGGLIWKFKTGGEKRLGAKGLWGLLPADMYMEDQYEFFLSSPVSDNGTVYFGSTDGNIYALDAATGKQQWKFATNGAVHNSPALANGMLYAGSWDTYLYALDEKTGAMQWKFKTGDQPVVHLMEGIQASPVYSDGMVYLGARDGNFHCLDGQNGKEIWKWPANGSWIVTTAAVKDSVVYFGTSDTYLFVAANAKTGKELYQFKAGGYVYSSPAITGNTAWFGDFTGKMYALDLSAQGKQYDTFITAGNKQNAATVLKNGSIDFMYAAGADSLPLYTNTVKVMNKLYMLGPIVSSPVIDNGIIYFGSADGFLYAVDLK